MISPDVCAVESLLKHIVLIYGSSLDGDVINTIKLISEHTAYDNLHFCSVKGRTILYLGGGGGVFVASKLFFLPPVENMLFFGDQRPTIFFFMFCWRNFLSYAFPIMYVTIWCFFWSTYFSSISTTNFFFLPIFSTNFFFLTLWRQTIFLILIYPPPPPDIKWCVCNAVGFSW